MKIEFLRPYLKYIPEVKRPSRAPTFKEKLGWTVGILILFFIMGVIYPYGVTPKEFSIPGLEIMQIVFASHIGSLISAGIGPIVVASIFLQLLVGAGIIELDLTRNEDRALFQGTQKILIIIFSFLEAAAISTMFQLPSSLYWIVVLQIAIGSIMLAYMDEIVSKYGIGSGIGLFIAAGVSQTIITATINPTEISPGVLAGAIPNFILHIINGNLDIFLLFSLAATIFIFLVVVYGESMKLEIPLSYGGIRGISARYPIKFFYVSNIPVILTAAFLGAVQTIGLGIIQNTPVDEMNPIQYIAHIIISFFTMGSGGGNSIYGILNPKEIYKILDPFVLLHIITYSIVFLLLCVFFGKFWAATTNIGPEKIAEQIYVSGLQIPGFRKD
ncbi:MAG: preprotein translocase subunit SecY, partial [Candidatus Altarchaeaceae archaeon]